MASHQWAYQFFWKPLQIEEIKPIIEHLKTHVSPEDIIYVHWEGAPAYEFYTQKHDDRNTRFNVGDNTTILSQWNTIHPQLESSQHQNIWLVFSHSNEKTKYDLIQQFSPMYKDIKDMQSLRASCIYLKRKE